MMSAKNILLMTEANGAVPARKSALDQSPLYGKNGLLRVFREQLETIAVARPQTPAYPIISSAFAEAVQNIINNADVRTELKKAAARIDQDIADNNGYPLQK
jgi:multiple sugar transport system substrate-binding protein